MPAAPNTFVMCARIACITVCRIVGPKKIVISAQTKNRRNFPIRIAEKNHTVFISKTPAANSNSFTGIATVDQGAYGISPTLAFA